MMIGIMIMIVVIGMIKISITIQIKHVQMINILIKNKIKMQKITQIDR